MKNVSYEGMSEFFRARYNKFWINFCQIKIYVFSCDVHMYIKMFFVI